MNGKGRPQCLRFFPPGMKFFELLLLLFFCGPGRGFVTETEWNIFMKMAKMTYVKNCFLAPRHLNDFIAQKMIKTLSNEHMYTVFLKPENLRGYLERMDMKIHRWTAIILKEKDLRSVDYFVNKNIIGSYFWIIFDASNGTLREDLQKIDIPLDSATVLVEKKSEDHYIISEYYNIKRYTPGVLRSFAQWINNTFLDSGLDWFDRKSNMQKYEFTTVKYNEDLYLSHKDKVNEAIWHELSHLLNFTVVNKIIQFSPENRILELESEEEEEALLDTQIYIGNSEKYKYLLGPTFQSGLYMHVKAEGEDKRLTRFIKPFSKYIWVSVSLWIFYGGVLMSIFEYCTRKFGGNDKPAQESFLMIFSSLDSVCNQYGSEIGNNFSSRFVLALIRFSGMLISYAYSATLISYLLLYIPQIPFSDLKGFVEDGTYKIVAERNSDVDTFFSVSSDPLERIVFEKFLSDPKKWQRLDKAMERLCAGENLVLVAFDEDFEKYKPCDIVKIEKPLKIFANGFKLRSRSPFRGLLHIKLLLMRTTGVLQRVNRRIINKNIAKQEKVAGNYEINMEKVFSVFFLLFWGLGLSVCVSIIETVIWKLRSSKMRKRRNLFVLRRSRLSVEQATRT